MIPQFWLYFLGTGIVTRLITPPLHFRNKTLTCKIRQKTNKNIHHFHFGLLIIAIALIILFLKHWTITNPILFFGAMGLSFIADEWFILEDNGFYFKKEVLLN